MFSFSALKKSDPGRLRSFVCCVVYEHGSCWNRNCSHHRSCPQHAHRQIPVAVHREDDILVHEINLRRALQLPRASTIHSLDLGTAGHFSSGFLGRILKETGWLEGTKHARAHVTGNKERELSWEKHTGGRVHLFCHIRSDLAFRPEPHTVCMPSYPLALGRSRSTLSRSQVTWA